MEAANGGGRMQDDIPSWRRLVDLTPSMMAYWGADLRCRLANRAYETWFGVTPDSLIGRPIQDLLGPKLFALNEPYIRAALRGEVQTFERVIPGPDGVTRHSLAQYLPDVVDGKVLGFVAQVTEVTALKEAQARLEHAVQSLEAEVVRRRTVEEALTETQLSLAVTLDSAGAGFITTGRDGRVTRLNEVAERICGWRMEEARGHLVWEVFKREGRAPEVELLNPIDVMVRDNVQASQVFKVTALSRSGARTSVEVNAGLLKGADDAVIGMAMVIRDLTERERAAQAEAREELRFKQVLEAAPSGLLVVNADRRIVLANRKAEELFGADRSALIGKPAAQFVPERPDDEGGSFARRSDGARFPAEIGWAAVETAEGSLMLATVVDLSARQAVEDELRRSNADLEQFAYIASHDLQEPLRMVSNYTELLAERYRGRLDEKADKYIFYAVDGAQRMQLLVKDLLAFSRVGSRAGPLTTVDTNDVVRSVMTVLHTAVSEANATVDIGPLPQVLGDAGQVSQVFQNLLGNSLKFRAQAPLVITVRAERDGERWRFSVSDTGIGIDPQYAERVFLMFQRLHARGEYEGSGIGLAIVKRIVERHGGRVWVESRLGSGATFFFTLRGAS